MKKINTEDMEQKEEMALYNGCSIVDMPTVPVENYISLLEEVDVALEEHGLEVVLLNEQDFEKTEPGVCFRIEKR